MDFEDTTFHDLTKLIKGIEEELKNCPKENNHSIRIRLIKINLELLASAKNREEEVFPIIVPTFMSILDVVFKMGEMAGETPSSKENDFLELLLSFNSKAYA